MSETTVLPFSEAEIAKLWDMHHQDKVWCWWDDETWPCPSIRLLASLAAANADRARLVARVDQLEYHARAVVTAQRAHYGSYVWSERLDRLQAVLDDTTTTTTGEGAE